MTRNEYIAKVESYAADLRANIGDEIRNREALLERTRETVDGSSLVIYTAKAKYVVCHSDNDGYSISEWGADAAVVDGCLNWSVLAFGALYADVCDALADVINLDDGDLYGVANALYDAGFRPAEGDTYADVALAWHESPEGVVAEAWIAAGVYLSSDADALGEAGVAPEEFGGLTETERAAFRDGTVTVEAVAAAVVANRA